MERSNVDANETFSTVRHLQKKKLFQNLSVIVNLRVQSDTPSLGLVRVCVCHVL